LLTQVQFITFILGFAATIATVLIAILMNNARLNDVRDALRAEIRAEVASSQQTVVSHLVDIIGKIAELDNRITRLER
jgi:hypothetical protein